MGDMQEALWGLHGATGSPKLLPITPRMALPPPTAAFMPFPHLSKTEKVFILIAPNLLNPPC